MFPSFFSFQLTVIFMLGIRKDELLCSVASPIFLNSYPWKVKVPLEFQETYRNVLGRQAYTKEDKRLIFTFRWWCLYVSGIRNNAFLVSSVVSHFPYLSCMSGSLFHCLYCNLLFSTVSFWRYVQIMGFLMQKWTWWNCPCLHDFFIERCCLNVQILGSHIPLISTCFLH